MAIHIHCPHCHERLEAMNTNCTHCNAALPPGVLYALSAALGDAPPPMQMPSMHTMPIHLQTTPPPAAAEALRQASPPPAPVLPAENSVLRPWLAAALSLVCGLGQLYNGQVAKGVILMMLATAAVLSFRLPIGQVMIPVLWLYAIVDAYLVARRTASG
jgi:TM2 domain-containing membrane protein YozV